MTLLWVCLGPTALMADERLGRLKAGQDVYTDVTVTSITSTDIYFTHSGGIGNVKLRNLEPALQEHFHFDPVRARAQQAEQVQANAIYAKSIREAPAVTRPVQPPPAAAEPSDTVDLVPPHPVLAKSFLGQAAPALTVDKWITGTPDTAGKFVLLDFWATWCVPCRGSIPELNEFQARFKDRLVVIGISSETEQVVRSMREPAIDYALGVDTQRRMFNTIAVNGIPHTMLVDPQGIVRFEGVPDYLNDQLLEELLVRYSH